MPTMSNYKLFDLDLKDEAYFGPPPRFLTEERRADVEIEDRLEADEAGRRGSTLEKIKSLLGFA